MPLLFNRATNLAFTLAFRNRLALVVQLFAARQRNLDLGAIFFEIHLQRHKRETFFLRATCQPHNFFAVHQQFAVAIRIRVLPARRFVRRDVHIHHPQLAASHLRVTIAQIHASRARGFDLGAGKGDPGFNRFFDVIIMVRFAIRRENFDWNSHNVIRKKSRFRTRRKRDSRYLLFFAGENFYCFAELWITFSGKIVVADRNFNVRRNTDVMNLVIERAEESRNRNAQFRFVGKCVHVLHLPFAERNRADDRDRKAHV